MEGREWNDHFSPFEKYNWIAKYAKIVKLVRQTDQQIVRVYHIPIPTEDAEGLIDSGSGVSRMWSAKPEARALFRSTVEIARLVLHWMAPDIIQCHLDLNQSSSEDDVQMWLYAFNFGIFRKFCSAFKYYNGAALLGLNADGMKPLVRRLESFELKDLETVQELWNALHPGNEARTEKSVKTRDRSKQPYRKPRQASPRQGSPRPASPRHSRPTKGAPPLSADLLNTNASSSTTNGTDRSSHDTTNGEH